MVSQEEIVSFVREQTSVHKKEILLDIDLFPELGLAGDDCFDLITNYSQKFKVDISSYLWYFHHEEEGSWNSIGGFFFKRPDERVTRIPVTISMLLRFAKEGKWSISYPPHKLPKIRYDILITYIILAAFLCLFLYQLIS